MGSETATGAKQTQRVEMEVMEIRLVLGPYKRANGSCPEHPDMVDIRATQNKQKELTSYVYI